MNLTVATNQAQRNRRIFSPAGSDGLALRPQVAAALVSREQCDAGTRQLAGGGKESAMPLTSLFLNVLWVVLGGAWMAAGWLLAALIMAITIIGLPWARAAVTIGLYTFVPFGHTVIPRDAYTGHPGLGTGPLGFIGNLIWLVLAGWWLAIGHLVTAIPLALSVIGLPFAWAHVKLAGLALWPIGKTVVTVEEADRLFRLDTQISPAMSGSRDHRRFR
jgi:uncharacterized membrane protein YccF (DUF307 family)